MCFQLDLDGFTVSDSPWRLELGDSNIKNSAVCVLIIEVPNGTSQILVIRRSAKLRSHRGQIGFPGGRFEMGDKTPAMTALRETYEEVGIPIDQIQVKGTFDPVVGLDGHLIFPVLGHTSIDPSQIQLNKDEVDDYFLVSAKLLINENRKKFKFNLFGCWRSSFLYDCGAVSIWGLSAEILAKINFRMKTV